MKRLVISCILILALTNLAYAMGSHHGGGGSHASVSSSGGSSGSGSTSSGSGSSTSVSNSGTGISPPNSPTSGNPGPVGGQGSTGGGPIMIVSTSTDDSSTTCVPIPEVSTLVLLGSALLGLWGVRRKIKR